MRLCCSCWKLARTSEGYTSRNVVAWLGRRVEHNLLPGILWNGLAQAADDELALVDVAIMLALVNAAADELELHPAAGYNSWLFNLNPHRHEICFCSERCLLQSFPTTTRLRHEGLIPRQEWGHVRDNRIGWIDEGEIAVAILLRVTLCIGGAASGRSRTKAQWHWEIHVKGVGGSTGAMLR
ncbi:hypothetical protein G7Y89_g13896 [Cudoniella acicularis]|uniref:Uncharacterized protein n=1 Tax=Cudoniella acicularis TaxID=354080 RepID=A0A8H4R7D0_9HELO|nr:hypothetical protein G7Y89_g13896 [Cudoniella acicularis]